MNATTAGWGAIGHMQGSLPTPNDTACNPGTDMSTWAHSMQA